MLTPPASPKAPRTVFPHTYIVKEKYWYFRSAPTGCVRLPDDPCSDEFMAAYRGHLATAGKSLPDGEIRRLTLRMRSEATAGTVYFAGWKGGPIKIGVAIDPRSRMRGLQTACPYPVEIWALAPGGKVAEAGYHARFARVRLCGEWFERCSEIESEIARLSPSIESEIERLGGGVS